MKKTLAILGLTSVALLYTPALADAQLVKCRPEANVAGCSKTNVEEPPRIAKKAEVNTFISEREFEQYVLQVKETGYQAMACDRKVYNKEFSCPPFDACFVTANEQGLGLIYAERSPDRFAANFYLINNQNGTPVIFKAYALQATELDGAMRLFRDLNMLAKSCDEEKLYSGLAKYERTITSEDSAIARRVLHQIGQ